MLGQVDLSPRWAHRPFGWFCHTAAQMSCLPRGPGHAETCLMPYANNKGADQPARPRSLIGTFVVRCLDSMIRKLAISQVSRF